MRITSAAAAPNYYEQAGNLRSGDRVVKTLLTGIEDAPDNFKFAYSYGGDEGSAVGEWTTPRHRHNFEQIRFPLEGDYSIGQDKVLPAGWVGYFPESAWYGPQVMSPNLTMLVLQFGGPSGIGYASVAQRRAGFDAVAARPNGRFEGGLYTWEDESGKRHNQDAFEAVWEEMRGEKVAYPKPRYGGVVLMNPANFSWIEDEKSPGVLRKTLGSFTEREIRIEFIRLAPGATLRLGEAPAPEVAFCLSGAVVVDGKPYGGTTAFGTGKADVPESLTAEDESEFFYVKLPTFAVDDIGAT